jgi:hypothetical protein
MTPEPQPDCWLLDTAEVRPSPIAGEGLFARAAITAGTVVSRLGGRLVTEPELHRLLTGAAYIDTITVTDTLHLVLPPCSRTAT